MPAKERRFAGDGKGKAGVLPRMAPGGASAQPFARGGGTTARGKRARGASEVDASGRPPTTFKSIRTSGLTGAHARPVGVRQPAPPVMGQRTRSEDVHMRIPLPKEDLRPGTGPASARYTALWEKRYQLSRKEQEKAVASTPGRSDPPPAEVPRKGRATSAAQQTPRGFASKAHGTPRWDRGGASRVHSPPRGRSPPPLSLSFDGVPHGAGLATARGGDTPGRHRSRVHPHPRHASATAGTHPRGPIGASPKRASGLVSARGFDKASQDLPLEERLRSLGLPLDGPAAAHQYGDYSTYGSPTHSRAQQANGPTRDVLAYQGRTLFADPPPNLTEEPVAAQHDHGSEDDGALDRASAGTDGNASVPDTTTARGAQPQQHCSLLELLDSSTGQVMKVPKPGNQSMDTLRTESADSVTASASGAGRRAGGYTSPLTTDGGGQEWLSPPRVREPPGDASVLLSPPRALQPPKAYHGEDYAHLTPIKMNLSESEEARRRALLKRAQGGADRPPQRPYAVFANPDCGTVFAEIHRQLANLPFWRCVRDDRDVKREVAAGKALNGQLPSVHLLLEDRYATDRIAMNWSRHKAEAEKAAAAGRRRGSADPFGRSCSDSPQPPHTVLVNSYSGTKCLTLKAAMVKTLRKEVRDPWSLTPEAFVLNAQRYGQDERQEFTQRYSQLKSGHGEAVWICKPSHRNKGIGIKTFRSIHETLHYVDTDGDVGSKGKAGQYVVQKYLERPFLVHKRKFDLRSWCVLTPAYDIYVFKEGVLRTASEEYDLSDLSHDLSHLTNHCIQEGGKNFGKYVHNNEMWYWQFQRYLDALPVGEVGHGWSLKNDILPQVNHITTECLLAARRKVTGSARAHDGDFLGCFQLFGFDFMIDDDKKVWLIEINGSPASAEALKENMMQDLINKVIAPHFPAPPGHSYPQPEPNKFELIYKHTRPAKATSKRSKTEHAG
eukprot:TRINITY_DN1322_c0_g1_i1.p1 TRINITY_DN1322_c0_g1~~TRINITY_DN1322_c0_g1_i1.p1  ORF type:complete len:951 (+),score=284.96 TRINITY_DN1322_c0_g1_i1:58-2910(+)